MDHTGKVAIVTGASKGIGRAIAGNLVESGIHVCISARTASELDATVEELGGRGGGEVMGFNGDVSDPRSCQALVDATLERFGALHILVNNAGIGIFKPIQDMTIEEWQLQIDVNLGGVFYCTRAAFPHLQSADDAWVINIASLASRNTFTGGAGYNASKFGLLGMTEAMMLDMRYEGIRTSIIMPGSVDTYFSGREPSPEGAWKLQSQDIARAVMDLLAYPGNALPSRIELRPTQPRKA